VTRFEPITAAHFDQRYNNTIYKPQNYMHNDCSAAYVQIETISSLCPLYIVYQHNMQSIAYTHAQQLKTSCTNTSNTPPENCLHLHTYILTAMLVHFKLHVYISTVRSCCL